MSAPLVSCIVPVFNGERFLGEALDSILGQTYRPLELIAVDDGSTDGTPEVLAGYADRLKCIRQENAGGAKARNRGLDEARGDFVAFLDADDLWHPDKLTLQLARLNNRPDLDVCLTHIQNFWMPELAREEEAYRNHRRGQALPGYSPVTMLARRSVFERVGRFDERLMQGSSLDWFLRAFELGTVVEVLPDVLVYRRLHSSNLSRVRHSNSIDEHLQVVRALVRRRREAAAAAAVQPTSRGSGTDV